jgi:hypothetical protein
MASSERAKSCLQHFSSCSGASPFVSTKALLDNSSETGNNSAASATLESPTRHSASLATLKTDSASRHLPSQTSTSHWSQLTGSPHVASPMRHTAMPQKPSFQQNHNLQLKVSDSCHTLETKAAGDDLGIPALHTPAKASSTIAHGHTTADVPPEALLAARQGLTAALGTSHAPIAAVAAVMTPLNKQLASVHILDDERPGARAGSFTDAMPSPILAAGHKQRSFKHLKNQALGGAS